MSRTEKKEKSPRGIRLIMHYFILFVIVYKRHFEQKHKRGSRKVLRRIFKFKIISAGANVIHECGLPKLGSSGICIQLEQTKHEQQKSAVISGSGLGYKNVTRCSCGGLGRGTLMFPPS